MPPPPSPPSAAPEAALHWSGGGAAARAASPVVASCGHTAGAAAAAPWSSSEPWVAAPGEETPVLAVVAGLREISFCNLRGSGDPPFPADGFGVREFPVSSRDITTKLSLGGNYDVITELFLSRGSLVSDIPAGDGKLVNLFLRCSHTYTEFRWGQLMQVIPNKLIWGQLMPGYTCWVQIRTADARSYCTTEFRWGQLMLGYTCWVQMRTADVSRISMYWDKLILLGTIREPYVVTLKKAITPVL